MQLLTKQVNNNQYFTTLWKLQYVGNKVEWQHAAGCCCCSYYTAKYFTDKKEIH